MKLQVLFHFKVVVYCILIVSVRSMNYSKNDIEDPADNAIDTSFNSSPTPINPTSPSTVEIAAKPAPTEEKLVCPLELVRPLFSFPCKVTMDCSFLGKNMFCCKNRCQKGVPPSKPEPSHEPTLFGLVERVCPRHPLPELFDIKECITDADCAQRICCPEKMSDGKLKGFCRTAEPIWDKLPVVKPFLEPLKTFTSYMQCTPPPPPLLDIFPKSCNTPLDCFPNLCCQERGKRYCRPPKRSLLALIADVGQRLIPTNAAKKLIDRVLV